ncbi:HAD family hydrolase [Flavobacterium amniphilum]|uniref:HAD family hydrolase n=1 Tax=Flavobacterium amniphilum TaxID=1834035 RepID=UPI00202A09D5|nr:HAD family hydrolase [Flavobacterium amniphilum]MCL9805512.1 HAD family hydrolase [Flavobacterium amniphilum]
MPEENKILVILDLDETLIHATRNPLYENWDFELFNYKIFIRPHLHVFLSFLKDNFDVAVWSSASDDYVTKVVEEIFPDDYGLKFVWGRTKCTYKPDYSKAEEIGYFDYYSHFEYIKILKKVTKKFPYTKEQILIIDDTPRKAMYNFGNAIYPSEFNGDKNDNELELLVNYLETFKDISNVRTIEKRNWRDVLK